MSTLRALSISFVLFAFVRNCDGKGYRPKVTERRILRTVPNAPEPGDYSQAVVVDNMVYVSGQLGIDPATGQLVEGGIQAQTEQSLKNAETILRATGSTLANAVRVFVMLNDVDVFGGGSFNEAYAKFFTSNFPARTSFTAKDLPLDALVEIEVIAVVGEIEEINRSNGAGVFQVTKRTIFNTTNAPRPLDTGYSQAVAVDNLLYISAQFGFDPITRDLVPGGIEPETQRALDNVKGILEAADSKIENVVKVTAMLTDKNDYAGFNNVYRNFFCPDDTAECQFPARSSYAVPALVPVPARIGLRVVALVGEVEDY